jgi:hypothetical protein
MMISTHLMVASVTPIPAPEFIPMAAPEISLTEAAGATILIEKSFTLQAGGDTASVRPRGGCQQCQQRCVR